MWGHMSHNIHLAKDANLESTLLVIKLFKVVFSAHARHRGDVWGLSWQQLGGSAWLAWQRLETKATIVRKWSAALHAGVGGQGKLAFCTAAAQATLGVNLITSFSKTCGGWTFALEQQLATKQELNVLSITQSLANYVNTYYNFVTLKPSKAHEAALLTNLLLNMWSSVSVLDLKLKSKGHWLLIPEGKERECSGTARRRILIHEGSKMVNSGK